MQKISTVKFQMQPNSELHSIINLTQALHSALEVLSVHMATTCLGSHMEL